MRLWSVGQPVNLRAPLIGRLTTAPVDHGARGDSIAYATRESIHSFASDWSGYVGVLAEDDFGLSTSTPSIVAPANLGYLGEGDVVQLFPDGTVQVLFRKSSRHNSILTTERCNSFCLMCSQPPREVEDSYRVGNILRLLDLIDPGAAEIGFTGGEPTLLGNGFFSIVEKAKAALPATALHILTNGRRFRDRSLAHRLGDVRHHDLMLGIPLYSDIDWRHDYVVQAKGAYDETLAGLYNLAASGVRIELRVVLHKQTYERLPELARFIARNLPFVEHVALMGLEMFGFTLRNLEDIWIDPVDYAPQLTEAVRRLALARMRVYVFNHQLCTIPRALWPFAVKSISDWKNVYLDECASCSVRDQCGGFFQSATKRHSAYIAPIADSQ